MSQDNYQNHKLVKAPVSFADVNWALSTSYTDLSDLCQSQYINRWARYKPVVNANLIDTTDQLNANNTWKTGTGGATWWKGSSLTYSCGIQISRYTNLRELIFDWHNNQGVDYAWQNYWRYIPPTGGTPAPFRLTDFNYYLHKSTLSGGEDNDKPFSGWLCGGYAHSIVRYRMGDQFMTDGQAQLYIRSDNPYLVSLSDLKVPSGAAFEHLNNYYFTVVMTRWTSSTYCNYSLTSATETFSNSNLVMTPTFNSGIFPSLGDYLAFPILTKNSYAYTSEQAMTPSIDIYNNEDYIPLPFYPITVTFKHQEATLKITPTATARKFDGGAITLTITYTATQLVSGGTNSWQAGWVQAYIQFFKGQQSPPEIKGPYDVPAGNTTVGTYTSGEISISGTSGGTDYILITLASSYDYIAVGEGYSLNV